MTGVAAMTAFYMFRLYYGIFWGTENKELHAEHTPHEAPLTMTFPLIFLSAITIVCGWLPLDGSWMPFGHFVSASGQAYDIHLDWAVAGTSIVIALLSIALATYIYKGEKQPVADALYRKFPKLHRAAYKRPIAWFDRQCVDGFMNFLAWGTQEAGESIRPWQSGDVRSYAVWFLTGTIALTLVLLAIML